MLLDSPFKEIHALSSAPTATIYAAAFSGAPGGDDRPAPSGITPPEPPRAAGRRRLGRDHRDHRRRCQPGLPTAPSSSRDSRSRARQGRDLPHPAGRLWDTMWEATRRLAVRPARRARRRRCSSAPARKARSSASPAIRARDAAGARPGAAGHVAPPRLARPRHRRDQQSRQSVRARHRRARRARHLRLRRPRRRDGRDWGAIRWRAARGRARSSSSRVGQHRDARRDLERLVEALHDRRRRARSPARTRATCSGARC